MAYNVDEAIKGFKAPEYDPAMLAAISTNLTGAESASAGLIDDLKGIGTAGLGIGTDIEKFKTDQLKAALAEASRAGMQLDPETGQPVDPTGTGLTTILDQARERRDDATGFDMSGMVDFNALNQYQKELAGDRRTTAQEFRAVAEETQLRSMDEDNRTIKRLEGQLAQQSLNINQWKEADRKLLAKINRGLKGEELFEAKQRSVVLQQKIMHELENQNQTNLGLVATRKYHDAQVKSLSATDKKIAEEAKKIKTETDLDKIKLKKLTRLEKKEEEKQQHEDTVDTQIETYNAFKAQGTKEQSWDALQHVINKNYQEGIAQPRLLELANQHLANSFDPTDGILKSELDALKGNRSSFARNKLLNTISKRLKAKYTGLIPAIGNSKGLAATIKAQAASVIDNYIDPTTQLSLGEEFKKESLYANRNLTEQLKVVVDNEVAGVQATMETLRASNASIPDQITALDKAKLRLTQVVDDKGNSLVNTSAAEKLLQPIRDRLLAQRNDLNIDSFKISTTDSQGRSIQRPIDLMKDLGISRLDLSLGKNPQARELASFTTFESKLNSALAQDSRLYNTSKEARALKRNQILNAIPGYSTVKLDATMVQSAKDIVEQVKIKGPGLQEEAKQKFMVSFRTNRFPSADISRQLINDFPAQYDKDNIDSEAVSADVEITYNNMKELYKGQWAHIDEATGKIIGVKNQDALDDLGYVVYRLYSGAEGKPRSWVDSSQEITSGSIPETSRYKKMVLGLPLGRWSTLEERTSISELSEDADLFFSIIQRSGLFPKARYKPSTTEEINNKAAAAAKTLNPSNYELP